MASSSISVAVGGGGGVVVELLQGGRGGQGGEPQPAGQPAGLGGVDLEGEQPFQGGGQRQLFGGGLVEDGGQCFGGGVQLERGQVAAQLLVEAGRCRGGSLRCRGRCLRCGSSGSWDGPSLGCRS